MKKFAVGYIDFFDNNLIIEIVEAEDWYNALKEHSKIKKFSEDECYLPSDSLEVAKNVAFNMDMMIDVVEISC